MAETFGYRRTAAVRRVGRWGRGVHKGTPFDVAVGIGLVTYGLVYLLVALIAEQLALTGQHHADTTNTALDDMAQTVVGEGLLWVTALGLAALTLWQLFETLWRRNPLENPIGSAFGRLGTICSAIGYFTLGVSAARVAAVGAATRQGHRPEPATPNPTEDMLLRCGVVVAGVILLFMAVRSIYRGARRRFLDDLKDGPPTLVVRLGQLGLIGKGITYWIVGALLLITAIDNRVGPPGLQTVLRLINLSPTGAFLLTLKAAGLALFGLYCFAWAAHRRR